MFIKDTDKIQEHVDVDTVQRTREITEDALQQRITLEKHSTGMDAQMDMTDPEARWGRKMDVKDVIKNLQVMNDKLIFEVANAMPTLMGMYIMEWIRDDNGGLVYDRRYIMAMENGTMPEFTIVFADKIEIPDPKNPAGTVKIKSFAAMKRGWRAILVTLLREKLITESDIQRHFKITEGRESRVWQEETGQQERITIGE